MQTKINYWNIRKTKLNFKKNIYLNKKFYIEQINNCRKRYKNIKIKLSTKQKQQENKYIQFGLNFKI